MRSPDPAAVTILEFVAQADSGRRISLTSTLIVLIVENLLLADLCGLEGLGGRLPAGRAERVADPVPPAVGPFYVTRYRRVFMSLQLPHVEGRHLFGQTVVRAKHFRLETSGTCDPTR